MDLTAGVAISLHLFLNANDLNPIHPYAQIEQNNWAMGAYYNSESTVSVYVSKTYELDKNYEIELGAVTGYLQAEILPLIRLKKDYIFIAPIAHKNNLALIFGLQF